MASEQFSLCWDNFHKNMSLGMQSLLENEDLVDVTLAVEGRYLKAHKMVLSVCSPYFLELFQTNPCKHPIIFMKDVSYIALSDLLQFMYQGEVQVAQENLPTFIKTAEALQIKGLTGDGGNQNEIEQTIETKRTSSRIKRPPSGPIPKRPKFTPTSEPSVNSVKASSVVTKTEISGSNTTTATADDILKFKMEPSETGDQSPEEGADSPIDTFDESNLDEPNIDDTQDDMINSLMETVDEPKAGTSTGDSQDKSNFRKRPVKRKVDMPRYIVDGFVFHVNIMKGTPPMTYLRCLEYKRLGCHARAIICDGNIQNIKINKSHNHPPDFAAEEKIVFLRELKEYVIRDPNCKIKDIYKKLSDSYPNASRQIPFNVIRHKMNRWRRSTVSDMED